MREKVKRGREKIETIKTIKAKKTAFNFKIYNFILRADLPIACPMFLEKCTCMPLTSL
jgi:hypothetical protein